MQSGKEFLGHLTRISKWMCNRLILPANASFKHVRVMSIQDDLTNSLYSLSNAVMHIINGYLTTMLAMPVRLRVMMCCQAGSVSERFGASLRATADDRSRLDI